MLHLVQVSLVSYKTQNLSFYWLTAWLELKLFFAVYIRCFQMMSIEY